MNDKVTEATAAENEGAEAEEEDLPIELPKDDVDDDGITEAELARLTPEERAALEDSDEIDEEEEAEGEEEVDVTPPEGAQAPAAADAPEAKADDPAPTKAQEEAAVPLPDKDPAEIAKAIDGLKAGMKAARTKFDDGELTGEQYDAEIDRLTEEIATAKAEQMTAQRTEDAWKDAWSQSCRSFADSHPEVMGDDHIEGFDREVRAVASNPAFDKMSNTAKLNLALERYGVTAKAMGKPLAAAAAAKDDPAKDDPKPKAKTPPKPVKSSLGEIPQTLAKLPAAATAATADGKFGQLQAKFDDPTSNPIELEAILSRMSEEEREAFASADI